MNASKINFNKQVLSSVDYFEKTSYNDSQKKISKLGKKIFSIVFKKAHWIAKTVKNKKKAIESGGTAQFKVQLEDSHGKTLVARVKKIYTLNEAIVYFQIHSQNDPLKKFLPQYIAVVNKEGKQLDMQSLLLKYSIEKLCKDSEFKPAYVIIRDLVDNLQGNQRLDESGTIKDFKMVRPSLQGTDFENRLHGYPLENFIYKAIKRFFFTLSGSSFAYQQSTKFNWFNILIVHISRVISVFKTKSYLKKEFNRLSKERLIEVKQHLANLRDAMERSNYVLADASLLFIPTLRKIGNEEVHDLDIRLIDMSQAMSKNEVKDSKSSKIYAAMKKDMAASIQELELMIDKILKNRAISRN
jgi:hypothetical protein